LLYRVIVIMLISCLSANSCVDNQPTELVGAEPAGYTEYKPRPTVRVSEPKMVQVTGKEILKFWEGPCFQLEAMRLLNPQMIIMNDLTSQNPINLFTHSPIVFVDSLDDGVQPLNSSTPVKTLLFDSYPDGDKFGGRIPDSIKRHDDAGWGIQWSRLNAVSDVLPPLGWSRMNHENWRAASKRGNPLEFTFEGQPKSDPMKFFVTLRSDGEGEKRIKFVSAYDFENQRKIKFSPYTEFSKTSSTSDNVLKIDNSGHLRIRLDQALRGGELFSQFHISVDDVSEATSIFNSYNRIIDNAIVPCETVE